MAKEEQRQAFMLGAGQGQDRTEVGAEFFERVDVNAAAWALAVPAVVEGVHRQIGGCEGAGSRLVAARVFC
jgi:hypothetical protein